MRAYHVFYDEFHWLYIDNDGLTDDQIKRKVIDTMYPTIAEHFRVEWVKKASVKAAPTFGNVVSMKL